MSSLDVDALLGDVYTSSEPKASLKNEEEGTEKESNEKKLESERDGKEKEKDKDKKKDKEKKHKDKEREKDKDRHREREKGRKRGRSPNRDSDLEGTKERKSKAYGELSDSTKDAPKLSEEELQAEQDARTVFATGLPTNVTTKELYTFFEKAGRVKDISLISDRNSKRSKGIGYIEYSEKASIPLALGLSGTLLNGHTVIIQTTMAEKNRVLAANVIPQGPSKVFFSNVDVRLIESDLELFFEQCGEVKHVEFYKDEESGKFIGSGFIEFKKPEEAKKAIEQCNGFRLLDKPMKVGSSGFEPKFDNRVAIEELDGDEQHIRMNSQARLALMNRLSHRVGQPFPVPIPILAPIHPLHIPHPLHLQPHLQPHPHHPQAFIPIRTMYNLPPMPTNCLMLSNMFSPQEAIGDENFEKEMKEEVEEECSNFGKVLHIFVDKNSQHGNVYIKFAEVKPAMTAFQTLNGRWFAGNQISVEYMNESVYNNRFSL